MKYLSTRDRSVHMESAQAIEMGLSRDGGLLTPERIPQIDQTFLESLVGVRYQERAARVMGLYLTDYTEAELLTFAENAYGPEKFDTGGRSPRSHSGRCYPLPGALARPHQRFQGQGAAVAAAAASPAP